MTLRMMRNRPVGLTTRSQTGKEKPPRGAHYKDSNRRGEIGEGLNGSTLQVRIDDGAHSLGSAAGYGSILHIVGACWCHRIHVRGEQCGGSYPPLCGWFGQFM